jgi:hypothetical protein
VGTHRTVISGVVLNEYDVPLEGISVLLVQGDERGDPARRPSLNEVSRTVKELLASRWRLLTHRDGHFTFHGPAPGAWRIVAFGGAYRPALSPVLEILAGERVERDIVLEAGSAIRGQVVDERGVPVEGAAVRARWSFTANAELVNETTDSERMLRLVLGAVPPDHLSGPDGSFSVPGISPGFYEVVAVKDGYARSLPRIVSAGDEEVKLVLPGGLRLQGTVTGCEGTGTVTGGGIPLAGAEVVAVLAEGSEPLRSVMRTFLGRDRFLTRWAAETDQNGAFEVEDLREGTYALLVRREDFQPGIFPSVRVARDRSESVQFTW